MIIVEIDKYNRIRINWRTKTLKKQCFNNHLENEQIRCLERYEKDRNFKHLGDFLNYPNEYKYSFLVIAELMWAFNFHNTRKIKIKRRDN